MTRIAAWRRPSRQLPAYSRDSHAFWTGGAAGELRIHRCARCGTYHHPPAPICHICLCRDVEATVVSGHGSVVSFTVNHHPWAPEMPVPFVVAYIAIDEQPDVWLLSNILACDPDSVHIGQRVRVVFERQDDIWVPLFVPDREDG